MSYSSVFALGREKISEPLATLLCRAIHPRFGIVRELVEVPNPHDLPRFYTFMAPLTDTALSRKGDAPNHARFYKGGSLECSYQPALWATVCEALERYSGAIYDDRQFRIASGEELGVEADSVPDLIGFSEATYKGEKFPCAPYDPKTPRAWVKGKDLFTGEDAFLPAQVVYFDYYTKKRSEFLIPSTTSGLAAGGSSEAAHFSALCEILERDAFMCHWLLKLSPPKAKARDFMGLEWPEQLRALVNDPHLDINVYNLELDHGIPIVLASISSPVLGCVSFGASCKADRQNAAQKALLEAVHSWLYLHNYLGLDGKPIQVNDVHTFLDHAAYYAFPERREGVSFIVDSPLTWKQDSSSDRPTHDLVSLVQSLRQLGYRVLAFDVTSPDVEQLGIKVSRVVVPGMHPLYCGKYIVDSETRLRRVHAEFMGDLPFAINREVHPFP